MKKIILFLLPLLSGCAQLHHVQVGEIDNRPGYVKKPFEVKISETGVDILEAGGIAKILARNKQGDGAQKLAQVISLFQMGPRTGGPVYVKDYAKNIVQTIYEKCPSGMVTGLTSIRETRKYPVVSGEIVKVTGFCLLKKEG